MGDRSLSYRKCLKIVRRYGVIESIARGKGSHRLWERIIRSGCLATSVPFHKGRDLRAGTIGGIRRRLELDSAHGVSDDDFYGKA